MWNARRPAATHAPCTYKIPTANDCPPDLQRRVCTTAPTTPRTRIHRSKAVGEPPLLLAFSVFLAIRDAVAACGDGRRDPPLRAPATPEAVLRRDRRGARSGVVSAALRRLAIDRVTRRGPTVVVEVVATRGSAPRESGTRMLVWHDDLAGTIGGGHLEWRAIATARAMLRDDRSRPDDETSRSARRSASAVAAP